MMFENLEKIIRESTKFNHGETGDVLEEWIIDAEKEIGKFLPNSYKWFLLNYGGGHFYFNDPIYTIAPPEFREDTDSDIVYQYKLRQKNKSDPSRIYFYEPEGEGYYFFDTNRPLDGEYPVVIDFHNGKTQDYGGNFEFFLIQEILAFEGMK